MGIAFCLRCGCGFEAVSEKNGIDDVILSQLILKYYVQQKAGGT
jgi:hypothetical protein